MSKLCVNAHSFLRLSVPRQISKSVNDFCRRLVQAGESHPGPQLCSVVAEFGLELPAARHGAHRAQLGCLCGHHRRPEHPRNAGQYLWAPGLAQVCTFKATHSQ